MTKIKVYPTKASALNVRHLIDGKLARAGSEWTEDGFTARLLTDGAITRDPGAEYAAIDDSAPIWQPTPIPPTP